ncbi:triacylglycerol lipase [Jeotgalibacillus alimentarius]|uniref:Triacylglycerol lipase n=1 Tax=Jeotgalibacillus alimentarius TaxID=135826 RepID=A0A0C2VHX9_9BACL|nr:alpha/beta fold hydrolase [Jeotgalibacillus alimentarius]KIL43608.1 triacylglycerol lipase [Jeotgalibacillus alimentarius]
MDHKVFLIHGFNKAASDMYPLEQYLGQMGYNCINLSFQLTFHSFEEAAAILAAQINEKIRNGEKVFLIGHSTGGIVIRKVLSDPLCASKVMRVVLVATPNQESSLAGLAHWIRPFTFVYKTLFSITPTFITQYQFFKSDVEIGATAGDRAGLLLGKMLRQRNDGRVETSSVWIPELKDYLILPYHHKQIHHRPETAKLIHHFLQTGYFLEHT